MTAMTVTALLASACGSTGGKSAAILRPASPVNLSVYVSNSRISVSPTAVGAGPVVFVVTNQSSQSEALAISNGSRTLASTAPISPQGTTQVTVNLASGTYTIATAAHGSNDAQRSQQAAVAGARFHVGRPRPSSSNQVLQP